MASANTNRGIGLGLVLIFESQIFPFMLSSAFTARTIVQEKGQVSEVQEDVIISVILSIAFSILLGYYFHDWMITLIGSIFGFVIATVYEIRGELI